MSERVPRAAAVLIAATMVLAMPFLAVGTAQASRGVASGVAPFFIYALAVLLSVRPIRIAPTVELSASEVAVLTGIVIHTTPTSRFPLTQVRLQRWSGNAWRPFGKLISIKPR